MHKDWRGRLHAYMGGIVNDLGGIKWQGNSTLVSADMLSGIKNMPFNSWASVSNRLSIAKDVLTKPKVATHVLQGGSDGEI